MPPGYANGLKVDFFRNLKKAEMSEVRSIQITAILPDSLIAINQA